MWLRLRLLETPLDFAERLGGKAGAFDLGRAEMIFEVNGGVRLQRGRRIGAANYGQQSGDLNSW